MTTVTTAQRGAAIALGLVLASGGLVLLFGDVVSAGTIKAFTQKHYLTLCIVVGTMLAFHVAYEAAYYRRFAACLGLVLIVLTGTGLIVYNSLGRQSEGLQTAGVLHDDQLDQRQQLKASAASDRKTAEEKRVLADKKCAKNPDGNPCLGARNIVEFYENSAKGAEARLLLMAPPKPVDAAAENFGNSAAAFGYDRSKAEAAASVIYRYLITLFFEFGTTVSLSYAFSPRWRIERQLLLAPPMQQLPKPNVVAEDAEPAVTATPNNRGNWGNPPGGKRTFSKTEALADLLTQLGLGKTIPSQTFLTERYNVDKGTVSKWLKDWEEQELIPDRVRVNRYKMIATG